MFKKTSVRFIVIGVAIVLALYQLYWTVAYNSFSEKEKEQLRLEGKLDNYEKRIIHRGLDLQGGIHLVLEVDLPLLVQKEATTPSPVIDSLISNTEKVSRETGDDFFDVFANLAEKSKIKLIRFYSDKGIKNEEIIKALREDAKDAINRALEIIRNRVDQFGVSEPTIQKQGERRIIVELAGIQDPARAKSLLQSTAKLEFVLLKDPEITQEFIQKVDKILKGQSPEEIAATEVEKDTTKKESKVAKDKAVSVDELFGGSLSSEAISDSDTTVVVDEEMFQEKPFSSLLRRVGNEIGVPVKNYALVQNILNRPEVKNLIPPDSRFVWSAKKEQFIGEDGKMQEFYLLFHLSKSVGMHGGYITNARANLGGMGSSSAGQAVVNLEMNSEGAKKWARLTGANINKRLAIVLDDRVYSAPVIRTKIPNGQSVIEGMGDMDEAKDLAIVLRAGALPAPVKVIEERTIGPSLGHDSIQKGTLSAIVGLIVVVLFMIFYYRWSGLIADLALILNLIFVLAILAGFGATLTLPGIAGLILTVGMAVDANVLIFERVREELRKGKTVRAAIDSGYGRAMTTILDANITTVLAALILLQFGTGPIKGFAITLFFGIMASLFTAIFVTRTIFNYFTERKALRTLSI